MAGGDKRMDKARRQQRLRSLKKHHGVRGWSDGSAGRLVGISPYPASS